ncbi:MAG: transcription-repair coupling factor [Spirochaeta sp. LUC14_002_19_P3]|nr:MAG: transcription-repair coupling factor [Spirochaeta sp. LUC14_002_19_P3]
MLDKFKTAIERALKNNGIWKQLKEDWRAGRFPIRASGCRGAWLAAMLADLFQNGANNLLVVAPSEEDAKSLLNDLSLFTDKAVLFPWWGTMLYRGVSPQASIFGRRAKVLAELSCGERRIVVTSLRAALGLLPPPEAIGGSVMRLEKGKQFNPEAAAMLLSRFGYSRVPRVTVPGEFAPRGEVLDIHPLGSEEAVRIVFSWEEIEDIRLFDPLSQQSSESLNSILLHPLKEVLWDNERIARLMSLLEEDGKEELEASLQTSGNFRGEELFYPLVFSKPAALQDYLGPDGAVVYLNAENLANTETAMASEYETLYGNAVSQGLAVPRPESLHTSLKQLMADRPRHITSRSLAGGGESGYRLFSEPARSFFGNIAYLKEEFSALLAEGYEIFIFAESQSQAQRLSYLLRDVEGLEVGSAAISEGFTLPEAKISAVGEKEIFGRRKVVPESVHKSKSAVIETFVDLSPGDYVVHVNYGIGLFKGIQRITAAGAERDYVELEYAGEETIFIPIEQVNCIQRYIGQEGRRPRLDRIGGSAWEKKKSRARAAADDLAESLIKLYARRQTAVGFAFPKDDDFQISFEASFPWEETVDQTSAIADVKSDMEMPKPMDRLVCGDVGYGKTEIAMRAAFKAIMGGRQVAYLCPTTILAEQHHESFTERFKRFPVTIAMLSRFVPALERKKVLEGIADGSIDIVIGTHRILSKDVSFKNMGLIIIDEEQRFGVKDKEKLKEFKFSLDCLTLSATPIPRTLHMSMVNIRDMSVLKTPPRNRLPIETFVQEYNEELIADAIRREAERGGQVFYLHNRISDLNQIKLKLQELVPEVFAETAHGQMTSRELEDIMHRFIHGAFQVLISTTIIENGIDIPNVNTIIIDRADMYGISQLYQLRGRVGRSGRLAYAYLFYPENKEITDLAMRRLQIISDFTELGSGFKIAMKDLEVRGAGNLLGRQQTGDIYSIGFDLYLSLLEEAIRERTEPEEDMKFETNLDLDYTGFIPDSYISDESEKMEVYKKIAAVTNDDELKALYTELHDRYGPLPDEIHSLISIAEIRIICAKLKVTTLKERKGRVQMTFGKVSLISVDKVMKLIKFSGGKIKLNPKQPDSLLLETGEVSLKEKSAFIRGHLEGLL